MQTFRRAGRLGQKGGQLSGRAGFGCHDGRVSLRCDFKGTLREAGQITRITRGPPAGRTF